ncbi:MAG TPA: DUF4190 domain-containing protein [Tepidisphaeraceae bacterium]
MPELQQQPGSPLDLKDSAPGGDSLSRLYHMSTTAGAGTQEYVAINSTAVASLILGLGSVLSLLSSVLLVIPIAGAICGILGIGQIRRSNQTQTGMAFAIFGLILSIGLGGSRAAYHVVRRFHVSADEKQISQLMNKLGQDLAASKYDDAYQLFNDRFHDRITRTTFENAFEGFRKLPTRGPIQTIEWNNEPMLMDEQPGTDVVVASAMAFFKFEKDPAPGRSIIAFEKSGGEWRIADIDAIFKNAPK